MQKRYFEYLADDSTFDLNRRVAGILPSGVYCGFDTATIDAGSPTPPDKIPVLLSHSLTGAKIKNLDGTMSESVGVIVTNQGVVIQEDSPIYVYPDEVAVGSTRIDAVIATHSYIQSQGGQPPLYSVIDGSSNAYPTLPTSGDFVLVCYLRINDGFVEIELPKRPQLGGNDIDKFSTYFANTIGYEIKSANVNGIGQLVLPEGNTFTTSGEIKYIKSGVPNFLNVNKSGRFITLVATSALSIVDRNTLEDLGVVSPPSGYKFVVTYSNGISILDGSTVTLLETDDNYIVVSVNDPIYNIKRIGDDLSNKGDWGNIAGFRTSVKQSTQATLQNAWSTMSFLSSVGLSFAIQPRYTFTDDGFIELYGTVDTLTGGFTIVFPRDLFSAAVLSDIAANPFDYLLALPYRDLSSNTYSYQECTLQDNGVDIRLVNLGVSSTSRRYYLNGIKFRR